MADDLYSPNLSAYLQRINYTGSLDVTLNNLHSIQEKHVMAITFENLDIHLLDKGTIDITPAYIESKILIEERGGYCWEQNTLLFYMLKAFGFQVRRVGCQVLYRLPVGTVSINISHMALLITIDNKDWLVDGAFGGMTATYPLDIGNESEISSPYDPLRRIRIDNNFIINEAKLNDIWHSLYSFSTNIFENSDAIKCNYNTYSNLKSACVTTLMVAKITHDARYTLMNEEFKIWKHDRNIEENEKHIISSPIELLSILEKYFDIFLPVGTILGPPDSPWPKSI
jgi:N-hydroxyarylamine O-acetyltransferase